MHRPLLRNTLVALLSASSPRRNTGFGILNAKAFTPIPFTKRFSSASASNTQMSASKVIDSHLHIWADAKESSPSANPSYPYADESQVPPSNLQNEASPTKLLEQMNSVQGGKVDGALIVQPINHKFDHSYVADAIKAYPTKFKGMMLHDPSLSPKMAVDRLEELVLKGFVGVRFNPYLWPEGELMSTEGGNGLAVYSRCGELKIPVGVMTFKGLGLHFDDILELISKSPETVLILDHLGFCALNEDGNKAFQQLLSLAKYPNVYVKISALFRNTGGVDKFPYEKVRSERFVPLMEAFGSERLMVGTDFPFVLETEGSYSGAVETVKSWIPEGDDRENVMGGTAERLFGKWG